MADLELADFSGFILFLPLPSYARRQHHSTPIPFPSNTSFVHNEIYRYCTIVFDLFVKHVMKFDISEGQHLRVDSWYVLSAKSPPRLSPTRSRPQPPRPVEGRLPSFFHQLPCLDPDRVLTKPNKRITSFQFVLSGSRQEPRAYSVKFRVIVRFGQRDICSSGTTKSRNNIITAVLYHIGCKRTCEVEVEGKECNSPRTRDLLSFLR